MKQITNDNKRWHFCAVGNIVKHRIDENGKQWNGTPEFVGGTKVYLKGKYWNKDLKDIECIGLNRWKKFEVTRVPGDSIENVRLKVTFKPKVIELMHYWEFDGDWWENTAKDKREIMHFIEEWKSAYES